MHSADYAVARCLSVYPSVRHTPRRYSVNTAENILKIFHRQVAPPFVPNIMAIFRRGPPPPPNEGVECKGVWKIAIFDQYIALSPEWCKLVIVTMEGEYETVHKLSNGTSLNEWPLTQFSRARYSLAASFDGLQPVLAACHCNFFFYIGK